MNSKKKLPSDYPSFIFRIPKEEKMILMNEIKRALTAVRKNQEPGDRLHNKNDVIIDALKIGLKQINSRKRLER